MIPKMVKQGLVQAYDHAVGPSIHLLLITPDFKP